MVLRIAIAIPARNKAANLPCCIEALAGAADALAPDIQVVVLANNCNNGAAAGCN